MSIIKSNITLADKIIDYIALAGDIPAGELCRLDGHIRNIRKTLQSLVEKKMLNSYRKDGIHSYRLTSKAKKQLLIQNHSRYEFFVGRQVETNNLSNQLTRRLRLHQMAQTWIMMSRAGVEIYRDKKPLLFENPNTGYLGDVGIFSTPTFYGSREVKEIPGEAAKINNSRSVGFLFTLVNIIIVFLPYVSVFYMYSYS